MNGSDEASPRCGRGWTRFSDLGARSHIRVLPPRGRTEGSNPSPSSEESRTNHSGADRAVGQIGAALYTLAQCDVPIERHSVLQSYRDKRRLWLSWISTDEHHVIREQQHPTIRVVDDKPFAGAEESPCSILDP
jgi:hypothetical protein